MSINHPSLFRRARGAAVAGKFGDFSGVRAAAVVLPSVVLALGCSMWWWDLAGREDQALKSAVRQEALDVASQLVLRIETQRLALTRLAATRLEALTNAQMPLSSGADAAAKPPGDQELELLVADYPELLSLSVIDALGYVQHSSDPGSLGRPVFSDLGPRSTHRIWSALTEPSLNGRAVVAGTFEKEQGRRGMVIAASSTPPGKAGGWIVGFYDCHKLLAPLLGPRNARDILIGVFDGRDRLFIRNHRTNWEDVSEWSWEETLGLAGSSWRVRAWPAAELVAQRHRGLATWLPMLGLSTAVLLAMVIFQAQLLWPRLAPVADEDPSRLRRAVGQGPGEPATVTDFDWQAFDRATLRAACERPLPQRSSHGSSGGSS